jgi:DNA-binding MurR/RpiR family transcriptional regulator
VVKEYLLEHPERVQEDTQEEIASDLGVSQWTVSQALNEIDVNDIGANKLSTQEKRDLVQSYLEANPDSSNREMANFSSKRVRLLEQSGRLRTYHFLYTASGTLTPYAD